MVSFTRLRIALLGFVAGLTLACFTPACFTPPNDDVLFACDPVDDPRCPAGYTCEADACCHKDGTDVAASFGACGLGGNETGTGMATDTTSSETSTDTTGTDTDTSTTDTSTTDSTDTGTSDTTTG